MRIAIGQMWQESNTFNRNRTRWSDFENWGLAVGQQIFDQYSDTGELGGFLSAAKQWPKRCEFIGLGRFACWPWGAVEAATAARILDTVKEQLAITGPLDGVAL